MSSQQTIEDQSAGAGEPRQGIMVPLDLPEFEIVSQHLQADRSIEVHVKAITDRAACPHCGNICVKIHDTRGRVKRDLALAHHQVRLVVQKRRFGRLTCRRSCTEPDSSWGRYKRSTQRFRDDLAKQAEQRPIAHIAQEAEGGPRFVQECLQGSSAGQGWPSKDAPGKKRRHSRRRAF